MNKEGKIKLSIILFVSICVIFIVLKDFIITKNIRETIKNYDIVENVVVIKERITELDKDIYKLQIAAPKFEEYSYDEKEEFVSNIYSDMNKLTQGLITISQEIVDNGMYLIINCGENIYETRGINGFYRNGYSYSNYDYLREELSEKLDIFTNSQVNYIENVADEKTLQNIYDLDESQAKTEVKYLTGVYNFNEGNFITAEENLSSISDYKDVSSYLEKLKICQILQGGWIAEGKEEPKINFSGFDAIYSTLDSPNSATKYKGGKGVYTVSDNGIIVLGPYEFYIQDGFLYEKFVDKTKDIKLVKYTDDTTLPTLITREDPKIGMTEEEVLESTWGRPNDINTTTTKYGVHEQWCYSGDRYIYFDNGIVTGIQDF